MLQQVITILLLILVFFITAMHYWKKFRPKPADKADPCGGCSSGCGGCPVLELKERIENKREI